MPIQSFRDLEIWRVGLDLVSDVYRLTAAFPREERYGLASQLQRSAVSVPANIAEGSRQDSTMALIRYLRHALASGAELETHLEIARRLRYAREEDIRALERQIVSIAKMTHALIASLKRRRHELHPPRPRATDH